MTSALAKADGTMEGDCVMCDELVDAEEERLKAYVSANKLRYLGRQLCNVQRGLRRKSVEGLDRYLR